MNIMFVIIHHKQLIEFKIMILLDILKNNIQILHQDINQILILLMIPIH
jgi:hypothetical protein